MLHVLPHAPGTCRLRADVTGGTASGVLEVDVQAAWQRLEIPGASDFVPQGIWGSGEDDIFIVGSASEMTILHYDGGEWTRTDLGIPGSLHWIWGSGPGHAIAVGSGGVIVRWDGTRWTEMTSGSTEDLYRVIGFGENDIHVLAGAAKLLHYDGEAWTETTLRVGVLEPVLWGPSADELYVVAYRNQLYRFDGVEATPVELFRPGNQPIGSAEIHGIFGLSSDTVWLAGRDYSFRYDGADWVYQDGLGVQYGVWASGPNDVYFVGLDTFHFDGESYTRIPLEAAASAVWGTGTGAVYAIGTSPGDIFRYDTEAR
jgi:hypothetical protein